MSKAMEKWIPDDGSSSPSSSQRRTRSSRNDVPQIKIKRSISDVEDSDTEIIFPSDDVLAESKRPRKLEVDEKSLTCQSCENLVISPVKSCQSGHLVCSLCTEDLKDKCSVPGCKQTTLIPCPFVENLLIQNDNLNVACKNADKGCKAVVKQWEMTQHLRICDLSYISCFEKTEKDCQGKTIKLNEFLNHLKKTHKSKDLRLGHGKRSLPSLWFYFLGRNHELHGNGVYRIRSDFLIYDGCEFIFHSVRDGEVMFWWLSLIGTEAEARSRKFQFKLKFTGHKDKDIHLSELAWKFPIHSIHSFDLDIIKETGHVASTDVASLKPFQKQGAWDDDGYSYDYIWKVHIEIVKPHCIV